MTYQAQPASDPQTIPIGETTPPQITPPDQMATEMSDAMRPEVADIDALEKSVEASKNSGELRSASASEGSGVSGNAALRKPPPKPGA